MTLLEYSNSKQVQDAATAYAERHGGSFFWEEPGGGFVYELEEDGWCCVRPSGTEPKLKIYYGAKGASREDAEKNTEEIVRGASALFEA